MIPNYPIPFIRSKVRQTASAIEELEKRNAELKLSLKAAPYITRGDLADTTSQIRNNKRKLDIMHELIRLWNEYAAYPTDEALLQVRVYVMIHGRTIFPFTKPP